MEKILSELKAMRLPGMAQTWLNLMEGHKLESMSLPDGMRLLLQGESDARRANRTHRLIKGARFRYNVTLPDIAADSARGIEQSRLDQAATCAFVKQGEAVIITGPTGTGKSWLATALGHHACVCGHKTRYFGMNRLFEEITMARIESRLPRFFERIAKTDLLILDDFGMKRLNAEQVIDLMEIIEDRHGRKATIIASQVPVSGWYETLESNATAADAILDRIIHSATRFELHGESLRKNV